jgi:hypothetical protein
MYMCEVEIPSTENDLILVIEGIKMGAIIDLDGIVLGTVTDQFLRYQFSINDAIRKIEHSVAAVDQRTLGSQKPRKYKLTITFDPNICTSGRFQACSGGWD